MEAQKSDLILTLKPLESQKNNAVNNFNAYHVESIRIKLSTTGFLLLNSDRSYLLSNHDQVIVNSKIYEVSVENKVYIENPDLSIESVERSLFPIVDNWETPISARILPTEISQNPLDFLYPTTTQHSSEYDANLIPRANDTGVLAYDPIATLQMPMLTINPNNLLSITQKSINSMKAQTESSGNILSDLGIQQETLLINPKASHKTLIEQAPIDHLDELLTPNETEQIQMYFNQHSEEKKSPGILQKLKRFTRKILIE